MSFSDSTAASAPARTAQDLLAERRANALELHRETDDTAKAMLQFHIDGLDRAIGELDPVFEASVVKALVDGRESALDLDDVANGDDVVELDELRDELADELRLGGVAPQQLLLGA